MKEHGLELRSLNYAHARNIRQILYLSSKLREEKNLRKVVLLNAIIVRLISSAFDR